MRVSGVRGEVGVGGGGGLAYCFCCCGEGADGVVDGGYVSDGGEVVCGGIIRGRRMGRWGLGDGICVRCGDGGMWLGWVFVVLVSLVAMEG